MKKMHNDYSQMLYEGQNGGEEGDFFEFDKFRYLMCVYTRMFCTDEEIVLADILVCEQKALTEKDLTDRCGLHEKQVREILNKLIVKHIIIKEQINTFAYMTIVNKPEASGEEIEVPFPLTNDSGKKSDVSEKKINENEEKKSANMEKTESIRVKRNERGRADVSNFLKSFDGSASCQAPHYYRINNMIIILIKLVLSNIHSRISDDISSCRAKDELFCPDCDAHYSSLDAQSFEMDPFDAHFLCKKCRRKLIIQDNNVCVSRSIELQNKLNSQLKLLRDAVNQVPNMDVPVFPPYRRADKNSEKINEKSQTPQKSDEILSKSAKSAGPFTDNNPTWLSTSDSAAKSDVSRFSTLTQTVSAGSVCSSNILSCYLAAKSEGSKTIKPNSSEDSKSSLVGTKQLIKFSLSSGTKKKG